MDVFLLQSLGMLLAALVIGILIGKIINAIWCFNSNRKPKATAKQQFSDAMAFRDDDQASQDPYAIRAQTLTLSKNDTNFNYHADVSEVRVVNKEKPTEDHLESQAVTKEPLLPQVHNSNTPTAPNTIATPLPAPSSNTALDNILPVVTQRH